MADCTDIEKYDHVLTSILVNEKSILGFLSAIFNFLARRTDFYYVPDGQYENMGFPPGVAEDLVLKVLRTCDPKNWHNNLNGGNAAKTDLNNEIMCSTVAQEVEIVAEEDKLENTDNIVRHNEIEEVSESFKNQFVSDKASEKSVFPEDYEPPKIPTQRNSESYNGAIREKYLWSQTIMELDITINLPPDVKSSKDLKVSINPDDICVMCCNGDIIIKDLLPYKIKTIESFWTLSEGRLLIHLEKLKERWWDRFLANEEPIDLDKIDCSRPLDELPEDHIAKVRELQWNQEQKMKGLPTSDEIRNIEILKKAWNADGSPFKGQEFDPSVLHKN